MWYCSHCCKWVAGDLADCPDCGIPRRIDQQSGDPQAYQPDSESIALKFYKFAGLIMFGLAVPALLLLAPNGAGLGIVVTGLIWMVCLFGAAGLISICYRDSIPRCSTDSRADKLRGRFAHPSAAPDERVYQRILELARESAKWSNLMTYRLEFREVKKQRPFAALLYCLYDDNPRVQQLAIFLLGLCQHHAVEGDLEHFAMSRHSFVRKRAIKALRNYGAWTALQQIARSEVDPQLRRLTKFHRNSFGNRLSRLREHLSTEAKSTEEMPLTILAPLPVESPQQPKASWRIRAVLERIRAAR